MDPTNIRELLDAHDKVPTKGEALQFKKSLGTNITLIAQREKTKLFFHNPDITTDLKRVEKALKYILDEEKDVKKSLKREIAKEEYKSMGEDPSKEAKKLKLMIPPDTFETVEHSYVSDESFNNFSCNKCDFSSTSEQIMIKHMEKKRKEAWTQMLEEKMKCDRRVKVWYESPSDFKHLVVKHNLPNPDIENQNDEQIVNDDNKQVEEDTFTTPLKGIYCMSETNMKDTE